MSPLPAVPLKDYAMIGNCQTAALVSNYGSIDWLCLPDFSSPSLFAKLLDNGEGGFFSITLERPLHASRRYLPDTAVLETTLTDSKGSIRITDCMPVMKDGRKSATLQPLCELLRRVEVIEGAPEILVGLDARPKYATRKGRFYNRGKLGWALKDRHNLLNLMVDFPLQLKDSVLTGTQKTKTGDVFWFSLTYESTRPGIILPMGADAEKRIGLTVDYWREWASQCLYEGLRRDDIVRSAITLKMLTFTTSGALMAAATTSLPERRHGWMNWDYRFCWPRDAALSLSAFIDIGLKDEANAFFGWLMLAANATRPKIHTIYDIYGRDNLKEKELALTGYGNAKPVRIGNKAATQVQHDVYGEVMMAVEDWSRHFGKPDPSARRLIEGFGRAVADSWREPDHGIWEIRDKPRHYTYSKVMAWHVFDSLIRLHEKGCVSIPFKHYCKEREELRRLVETEGFDKKRNCFRGVFGEDVMDVSLLLLPQCGFIQCDDPRMLGTWEAIQGDLEQNGLLLRYPPGFAGSQPGEGAFIICNFWAVDYLAGCNRKSEALARLEKLIGLSNDVGLFNEAVDVETCEALGNMPQAFSHAGLIHSVTTLFAENIRRKETA